MKLDSNPAANCKQLESHNYVTLCWDTDGSKLLKKPFPPSSWTVYRWDEPGQVWSVPQVSVKRGNGEQIKTLGVKDLWQSLMGGLTRVAYEGSASVLNKQLSTKKDERFRGLAISTHESIQPIGLNHLVIDDTYE